MLKRVFNAMRGRLTTCPHCGKLTPLDSVIESRGNADKPCFAEVVTCQHCHQKFDLYEPD